MRIELSDIAQVELLEIWNYNAERYGLRHADEYEAFLTDGIAVLADDPEIGTPIEGFPNRRALTIRRRPRGHGHVAVYRIESETVRVLHVFHTAQDARGRMERE